MITSLLECASVFATLLVVVVPPLLVLSGRNPYQYSFSFFFLASSVLLPPGIYGYAMDPQTTQNYQL